MTDTPENMVERVARALAAYDRDRYKDAARAAIEAMRTPTFDMVSEGGPSIWCTPSSARHERLSNAYQAMIDAILEEDK